MLVQPPGGVRSNGVKPKRICDFCGGIVDNRTSRKGRAYVDDMGHTSLWFHDDCRTERKRVFAKTNRNLNRGLARIATKFVRANT